MRSIRWLVALGLLLRVLCAPASAMAAEMPRTSALELTWQAPAECPEQADVEREILRLLARSKHQNTATVAISVRRQPSGVYRLELTLLTPVTGNRTLSHKSCASAARAAALIVAMAIDADAVSLNDASSETLSSAPGSGAASSADAKPAAEPSQALPAPKPSHAAAPQPPPAARKAPASLAADEVAEPAAAGAVGHWQTTLNLGAVVESTFTPTLAFGAVFGASIDSAWFRAGVAIAGVPNSTTSVPSGESPAREVGARFSLLQVELDVCGGRFQQRLNIALCGALRGIWIRAAGRGVDDVLSPTVTAPAVALGPILALRLIGPLGISASGHAVVPLRRPKFVVDGLDTLIFRPARVGVGGALSVSCEL